MKRLFALTFVSQLSFVAVLLSVRLVGMVTITPSRSFAAQLTQDSAVADTGWCWRGVCPGVSTAITLAEVIPNWPDLKLIRDGSPRTMLTTLHLESVAMPRWTIIILLRQAGQQVQRIQIQPEMNAMTIGELIVAVGTPVTTRMEFAYGLWTTVICFQSRLCAGIIDNERHVTVQSKVDFLEYAALDTSINQQLAKTTRPWRGFTAWTRH